MVGVLVRVVMSKFSMKDAMLTLVPSGPFFSSPGAKNSNSDATGTGLMLAPWDLRVSTSNSRVGPLVVATVVGRAMVDASALTPLEGSCI
jgi:hypothetical protein